MTTGIYLLLFLAPFAGGLIAVQTGYKNELFLKTFLAFAGGYIFSITILNLLPEVFSVADQYSSLLVLGGFFFQIMIGRFSEGAEHGHLHTHNHDHHLAIPIGLFLSMCLHAFTEGVPLGMMSGISTTMAMGIALHELPAAFALLSILRTEHIAKRTVIIILFVYALMSPGGAFLGDCLRFTFSDVVFSRLLAFVAGIFLYISTTILFENSENHHFNSRKLIAVSAGVLIAILGFFVAH